MFVQKIKKIYTSEIEKAEKYYSILATLNNLHLTKRDVQLISFLAVNGSISSVSSRKEFCSLYRSTIPTINNMVSKLKGMGILYKDGNKFLINPKILPKFDTELVLILNLDNERSA